MESIKKPDLYGFRYLLKEMQGKIVLEQNFINIPKPQYLIQPNSLQHYEKHSVSRNHCIKLAYDSGGFSLPEIADYFGLHYSWVSRIVKKYQFGMEES